MVHQVEIPPAGETITSATVAQWHVADGAVVERGQRLATIETDKVSSELAAEQAGTLTILVPECEEVRIGAIAGTYARSCERFVQALLFLESSAEPGEQEVAPSGSFVPAD